MRTTFNLIRNLSLALTLLSAVALSAETSGTRAVSLNTPVSVPGAAGQIKDVLLENEHIAVVIAHPNHVSGNMISGGYIIDAWRKDAPRDQLAGFHLYLNDEYPRMARFTEMEIVSPGGENQSAEVVAHGIDSNDPTIEITTRYIIEPGTRLVKLITSVTPRNEALKDFVLGDAFAWGPSQQFVPGFGYKVPKQLVGNWLGATGNGVAYGYFAEDGSDLFGPLGSTWADPNVTTATIAVDESASFTRYLAVTSDLAGVAAEVAKESKQPTGFIEGVVTTENGAPADNVRVNVAQSTAPISEAYSSGGRFRIPLPPGNYTVVSQDRVRSDLSGSQSITITADQTLLVSLQVASPAKWKVKLTDAGTSKPMSGKITLVGFDGTSNPNLGPAHESVAQNVIYIKNGEIDLTLPAGNYHAIASCGIEYHATTVTVELKRSESAATHFELDRAFETPNALSADFHLHMQNSFDSAVTFEDRVISCVGEGLAILVATDHNYITDLQLIIKGLWLDDRAIGIIGNEITTRKHMFGHFNAFPLTPDPSKPGNGAAGFESVTAQELMAAAHAYRGEQVVQINHPRADMIGYFNRINLARADGLTTHSNWSDTFTAVEVFNGKRVAAFQEVMRDWFNLLNIGYRVTGTGNSDSHKVYQAEPGYPRNYVFFDEPTTVNTMTNEALAKAVNEDHAVLITNGPYITVKTDSGKTIGDSDMITSGPVRFHVKIEGPNFVKVNDLRLYANGKIIQTQELDETAHSVKFEGVLEDSPTTDTWYAIYAGGDVSMHPIYTEVEEQKQLLAPVPAAVTNPIWIDRDGDSKFTAPRQDQYDMMHQDRSAKSKEALPGLIEGKK